VEVWTLVTWSRGTCRVGLPRRGVLSVDTPPAVPARHRTPHPPRAASRPFGRGHHGAAGRRADPELAADQRADVAWRAEGSAGRGSASKAVAAAPARRGIAPGLRAR